MSRPTSADLQCLSPLQRGAGMTIRVLDPRLAGDPLRARMAKVLLPENLFGGDVRLLPALYQEIRDHLPRNGAKLATHSLRRIVRTLTNCMDIEPEVREMEKKSAIDFQSGGSSQLKQPIVVCNSSEESSSSFLVPKRVVDTVAMGLKNAKEKYFADTSESWDG